jgi:hypothetical protein
VDRVRYTEDSQLHTWANSLIARPTGQEAVGINGFAPRRDQLGILKRNGLWQITGDSNANFRVVQIQVGADPGSGKGGCLGADTICVINDRAYWLGRDGVYEWGPEGVRCISDDAVRPWFTTDTYFNRSRFQFAFGKYNELRDQYEIHLANANDSTENRWIAFNLRTRKWYGPNLTAALTPTHAAAVVSETGLPNAVIGGADGIIYTQNSATYHDGTDSVIDFDVHGRFHHGDAPDVTHMWLRPSIHSKVETAGALEVIPYVGALAASAGTTKSHTLTTGREVLTHLGAGRLMKLRFRQNTVDVGVSVFGYEVPFFEIGRR